MMNRAMTAFAVSILILVGCGKEDTRAVRGGATQPATAPCDACTDDKPATQPAGELPPGHPPLPTGGQAQGMPPGHGMQGMGPHGMMGGQKPAGSTEIPFNAPADWTAKAPRGMTAAVFALAKAEGDAIDADLAVSSLGIVPPWDMNVARWKGQLQDVADFKEMTLEGTKYPTKVVAISGAYQGNDESAEAREGFRILAAEVVIDGKPWYVKLIGPAKTVTQWEESYMNFVRSAE